MAEKKTETKVTRQQLLEQLQSERAKLEILEREMTLNRSALSEVMAARSAVKAIEVSKEKSIIVPLGAGVFMETTLDKQALKVMTNTVMFKTNPQDVQKELEERRANIEKNIESIAQEQRKSLDKYVATQQILQMADQTYMRDQANRGK